MYLHILYIIYIYINRSSLFSKTRRQLKFNDGECLFFNNLLKGFIIKKIINKLFIVLYIINKNIYRTISHK